MGGDEFLIACNHFSAEEAEQLIERLHGELARQSDDRLKLDVAFGYHTVTEGPFDYIAVYHAADRDMYRNKRKNR
jgi:GGDEF domain-containing protein